MSGPDVSHPQALASDVGHLQALASTVTAASALAHGARSHPAAVALVGDGRSVTYAELDRAATEVADGLRAAGVARGDRVLCVTDTCLDFYLALYGLARRGAITCSANPRSTVDEIERYATTTGATAVVVQARAPAEVWAWIAGRGRFDRVVVIDGAAPAGTGPHVTLDALRSAGPSAPPGPIGTDPVTDGPGADDILAIFGSSGTTGRPKCVAVSHRAMTVRSLLIAAQTGITPDEAFIAWMPCYHNGGIDTVIAAHWLGQKVIVQRGFDPDAMARVLAEEKVGWLQLVPGTIRPLGDALERSGIVPRGVRVVGTMPDLIPPDDIARLTGLLGAPYLNTYGSSETSLVPGTASVIPAGRAPTSLDKVEAPFCEVRLVDPDGAEVGDGRTGELLVRSPTMFSGYWNDPDATRAALAGGWYHTGDLFLRRPDGRLAFVGRTTDMIKSGGENVYPQEVEAALVAIDGVTDAVVVGVPDPRWGEMVVAVVAAADTVTPDRMRAACRAALAPFKIPKEFRPMPPDQFDRNATGKVRRSDVQAWVLARAAAEGTAGPAVPLGGHDG